MTSRVLRLVAAAIVAPIALSGCSVFQKKAPPPCPPVYILSDASHVTKFRPGPGRDLTDVEMEAEVIAFKGGCSYDDKGANVELQLSFMVKRGAAGRGRNFELSYFVAIPKFFPDPAAKGVFTVPVVFPEGVDQARVNDEDVTMAIPVKDKDVINNYEIYIGIQTTPEELELNRRSKR